VSLVPQLELRLLPTLHLGDVPVAYTDGSQEVERLSLRTSSLRCSKKRSSLRTNFIHYVAINSRLSSKLYISESN